MNRIDGKVAIITGSTQGLGAAIAHQFAQAGAAGIVITGRNQVRGKQVSNEIATQYGIKTHFVAAELDQIDQVRNIVTETDQQFGRVDLLVNAAGLTDRGNLLTTSPELFDQMFAINTKAPFFLMQESVKVMIREKIKGAIINIGSMSEHAGQPFLSPYCASKGALATLTRNSGYALLRNQIRVNQLDIGWMNSDHERELIAQEKGDDSFIDRKAATLPAGRILQTDEVAKAVLWMASEDSGMMTGSVIQFDQTIWGAYDDAAVPDRPIEEM